MSDEYEEDDAPRFGLLLRFGLLALLMAGMLGLLIWQRRSAADGEVAQAVERQRRVDEHLREQQAQQPPPSLYGIPDVGEGPEIQLQGDLDAVTERLLTQARAAKPQIDELRARTLRPGSSTQLVLPDSPSGDLDRDAIARYLAYRLELVEEYQRLTGDTGDTKAAGAAFLEANFSGDAGAAPLRALADAAIAAGSTDPLVRVCHARLAFFEQERLKELDEICLAALSEAKVRGYSPYIAVLIRSVLYESGKMAVAKSAYERSVPLTVALVRWLEHEGQQAGRRDVVYQRLLRIVNSKIGGWNQLHFACAQSPKVDPWYVQMMAGHIHHRKGWDVRGGGYASEVKSEAWDTFHSELRKAADHYEYAWLMAPELPYAAEEMIRVANAGRDIEDSPTDWFLRAVAARLDYYPAYSALDNSRLSRWGGSVESLLDFGNACLESKRFDTRVPCHLLDVLENVEHYEAPEMATADDLVDLPFLLGRYRSLMKKYRESHPDRKIFGDGAYYRARLVKLLINAKMEAEAAEELEAAGDNVDYTFLQQNGRYGHHESLLIQAAQGDVRDRVRAFDEQLRQPWPPSTPVEQAETLRQELETLRPLVPQTQGAKRYLATAELVLNQLTAFSQDKTVELNFDAEGTGWELHAEGWELLPDKNEVRLHRRGTETAQAWARPIASFQPPFELELELEAADPPPYPYLFGVQWIGSRLRRENNGPRPGRSFLDLKSGYWTWPVTGRKEEFSFPHNDQMSHVDRSTVYQRSRHPIRIRVWSNAYESLSDPAWGANSFAQSLSPEHSLYIGESYPFYEPSGEIRIANVRIKSLKLPAPPEYGSSWEAQTVYLQQRYDTDHEDDVAAMQLARFLFEQKKLDEALKLVQAVHTRHPDFDRSKALAGRTLFGLHRYAEAKKFLEEAAETKDDPLLYACLIELACAGPENLRQPLPVIDNLLEFVTKYTRIVTAETLAAQAVAYSVKDEFEQARDRNREAIAMAREPYKSELIERQQLYDRNQPFLLPPEVKAE